MRICVGDLEANGFLDVASHVHCGVFKDINTLEVFKFRPTQVMEMLAFMDTIDVLIMHNGIGYDWPLLKKLYNYEYRGKKVDTLIMSRLHGPNRPRPYGYKGKGGPHSIECWGFRIGRWKPDHTDWDNFSDDMLHRCTEDVEILHLVYNELLHETKGYSWRDSWLMTFRLFEILHKQEEYGWLVDKDQITKSLYFLNKWMDKIDVSLDSHLPHVIEIKETKKAGILNWIKKPFVNSGDHIYHVKNYWGEDVHQVWGPHSRINVRKVSLDKDAEVKDFLLNEGWIPLQWNTNDQGERTSPKLSKDDPFEGIQGRKGRLIAKRVQCKHRRAQIEGWESRVRPDGRLPSKVTGLAATGRAKHSEIVNVPNVDAFFGKWMRRIFKCPPGRKLIGCDAGSCQDRMLAQRANDQEFTDMLLNGDKSKGTDGHSLAMKGVNRAHSRYGVPLITRQKGKNYNFAWKFGASDNKLGMMSGSGKDVGGAVRQELSLVFPAQAALVDRLTEEWRSNAKVTTNKWGRKSLSNGYVIGLDGRPIFIESEHAILVYVLQSDEAICMTAAYCMLYKRLLAKGYEWGKDWAYVCWYHDEYTIECREELAEEIAEMAEQAIVDAGKFFNLKPLPSSRRS